MSNKPPKQTTKDYWDPTSLYWDPVRVAMAYRADNEKLARTLASLSKEDAKELAKQMLIDIGVLNEDGSQSENYYADI